VFQRVTGSCAELQIRCFNTQCSFDATTATAATATATTDICKSFFEVFLKEKRRYFNFESDTLKKVRVFV
jgi:hypothetical protein